MINEDAVKFNARGMDISESLVEYFLEKFNKVEHQDLIERVDVEFAQTKSHRGTADDFYVRVLLKLPKAYVRVKKTGNEIYAIVDEVNDIIAKKVQQYFDELSVNVSNKDMFVLPDEKAYDDSEFQKYLDYKVRVRRKDLTEMAPISIEEAVQHLELLDLPAYLFRNVNDGDQVQMIYKDRSTGEYVVVVPPKE